MLVGSRFHVLFHSPPGVLFTFPSRYCFAIGHTVVLSLTRWSSRIHTEFHVLRATRDTASSVQFSVTGLSPSVACHSSTSPNIPDTRCCPTTPILESIGLGSSPFARRYLGSRFYFPFLQLLRCFSWLGSLVQAYIFSLSFLGCPIRKFPDQSVLPAPRDLSQVTTSFIASVCQGIRREPFVA